MKEYILKILRWAVKELSILTLKKYRPTIVGVTGSVGKTSTKLAIAAVLGDERSVRYSRENFNNELGLPLVILGSYGKISGTLFWLKVIFNSIKNLFKRVEYPEILILEYGVDRPGDMKYLLSIAKPNIGVITAIGETPAHVEYFDGPEAVAREKGRLVESLLSMGHAILNGDDKVVMELKERTRGRLITFGFEKGASVRVANFESKEQFGIPVGISFKLEYGGSFVPVKLNGIFGKHQAYASAAAACVGLSFGMNLHNIAEGLAKNYKPAEHRMSVVTGINNSVVLDDSYNANPLSMKMGLDSLNSIPGKRKIAVLGDMLEIGKYAMDEHKKIGAIAGNFVDILFTVGSRSQFIAEGAKAVGMAKKNIFSFGDVDEAIEEVKKNIRKGDTILVKGSHSINLEKLVDEIKLPLPEKQK